MISSPAVRWGPARDLGVDLARGAAIVAMIIAHVKVWAAPEGPVAKGVISQINDVASPLFCLLMGVALGLVMRRPGPPPSPWAVVARGAVRGGVLIAIGLLLQELDTFVAIVLQYLGVVLLIGTPLALLPMQAVGALAGFSLVLGPTLNAAARSAWPPGTFAPGGLLDHVSHWFVLGPSYRFTNLIPLFLLGVLLGRVGPSRPAARQGVLAVGLLAYASALLLRALGHGPQHSGDLVDNLADVGLSFTALGLCLLVATTAALRPVQRALTPFALVGTVALSAYVLHIVLIAAASALAPFERLHEIWLLPAGGVLLLTLIAAWAWARQIGRGPIERLLDLLTRGLR